MKGSKKVKFQDDYDGCFKEFKGQVLTIKHQLYCDEGDSCYWYQLQEINEPHLIKSKHFQTLNGTKIL